MDFAPHAARLAKHARATAPRRVLETAAGTGALTRELARILPVDVSITATDLNEPMMSLAQSKLGNGRILWRQADALDLPFGDAEFDVVVCQFGVMFFPDKQQGFHEALRVLRPGGHFLFNVWGSFEANSESPLRIAARIVGAILDRDPVSLLSSPYHDQGIIRSDLGAAGFVHVAVETASAPSRAASAHEAATIVCHGSRLRTHIDESDPTLLEEITGAVTEALRSRFGAGPVEGTTQALMLTAQRPIS
jgi:SAM-dependent methyltransferase